MFNCLSDRSAGLLALVVYGPYALLAGIVLSLLLLAVMNAVSHGSPVLNGIIAGLPAIAMALVVTAGAVAIRTGPEKPEKPAPVVTQCVPISGGRGCPGG